MVKISLLQPIVENIIYQNYLLSSHHALWTQNMRSVTEKSNFPSSSHFSVLHCNSKESKEKNFKFTKQYLNIPQQKNQTHFPLFFSSTIINHCIKNFWWVVRYFSIAWRRNNFSIKQMEFFSLNVRLLKRGEILIEKK